MGITGYLPLGIMVSGRGVNACSTGHTRRMTEMEVTIVIAQIQVSLETKWSTENGRGKETPQLPHLASCVSICNLGSLVAVVQSLSRVWLSVTPWTAGHQASLFITMSQSLLKLMSVESVIPSHHLILCRPLLLLPSIFPSIRVFSNQSVLHIRWPKYWSFSISPSIEYSGLISFRIDWFDLLAVQRTVKSLLQHHSSKASSLRCSVLYSPTLTSIHDYWTFVGKVMSLLFDILSKLVITFLPRNIF